MSARIPCALPTRHTVRLSPDSAWPLKRADGTAWHKPSVPVDPAKRKGKP